MKKLLLSALIVAVIFGYQRFRHPDIPAEGEDGDVQAYAESGPVSTSSPTQESVAYHCDGREYCSQMKSYEEAVYFLRNCPGVKMDGDHDGVPCESQFHK